MAQRVSAKRAAPAQLSVVYTTEVRIRHVFERHELGQRREYSMSLVAELRDGSREIWRVRLYEREYRLDLEGDVQEIHLKALIVRGDEVVAIDERKQMYKVSVRSGLRLEPQAVVRYPKAS
ncbi:MAG TPA: hypothetical protein PLZ57_08150 [Pseudobdellovibrionaceae bacterium]|nr:hypothetical protein [Pseudobdellovibrionaceae bacterium]